ncbi:hypothetical protein [Mucilaginibacter antarcticus]|uniref:hypothetical protein n=1 Tax=Mucilaginibacter antarcticus TaxID=1855725 RepID=UPI00363CEF92
MGEIIYELNNNINANNFPEFEYAEAIDKNDLKKNNIIALLSHDDPLMEDFLTHQSSLTANSGFITTRIIRWFIPCPILYQTA